jgi:hypothetical protein
VHAHETIGNWQELHDRGILDQVIADNIIDFRDYFGQTPSEAATQGG